MPHLPERVLKFWQTSLEMSEGLGLEGFGFDWGFGLPAGRVELLGGSPSISRMVLQTAAALTDNVHGSTNWNCHQDEFKPSRP